MRINLYKKKKQHGLQKKTKKRKKKKRRKTRRKRRGGKYKKPSRRHCTRLRHQHRQIAHSLHRVSKAINVQCGMHG